MYGYENLRSLVKSYLLTLSKVLSHCKKYSIFHKLSTSPSLKMDNFIAINSN